MPKKSRKQIQDELMRRLKISRRRTRQPIVVAMIGVSGSGLSMVSRELSRLLGWTVVEKNKIRVKLREEGPGFTASSTNQIHDAIVHRILDQGGNVILDSDFVEPDKRRRLQQLVRPLHAAVVYLRITCDPDTMIQRMLRAAYNPKTDIFASPAIAVREHCRRLPWHYRLAPAVGGRYALRQPPAQVLATIDTTDPEKWRKRLRLITKRLKRM